MLERPPTTVPWNTKPAGILASPRNWSAGVRAAGATAPAGARTTPVASAAVASRSASRRRFLGPRIGNLLVRVQRYRGTLQGVPGWAAHMLGTACGRQAHEAHGGAGLDSPRADRPAERGAARDPRARADARARAD